MSTIADYSVFTKAFLASGMTDFSQLYGKKFQGEEAEGTLRAFAVIPFNIGTPLTPREAMNFDWSKLGLTSESVPRRVSCQDADGNFIGNIVRVQPGVREGSIRLVAKVAVTDLVSSEGGSNPADATYNTFVLVRTDALTNIDLPIAVATISAGYMLHKHVASGNDPLDDVENANYVSFTINNLNGYTSVDFNPDAYATYDDVANALSRGIDGLHIAFDTASGDLKLLDKDGNVLDQANLPIKADVIIADGEEGYKYVKTDVKQDIHAAKAWMPEGSTAWKAVEAVPYTMQKAALVVGKGSTSASKVFVSEKPVFESPVITKSVSFEHVAIDGSTYMVVEKTGATCHLRKVKGEAGALEISAGISGVNVTPSDSTQSYTINSEAVEVDVIEYEGVTYVLVGPEGPGRFKAQPVSGERAGQYVDAYSGIIVTFGGSTTASKVFVDPHSGSYPISTEPVLLEHVVIDGSTYMVVDKNKTETQCNLVKVKGEAGALEISNAGISGVNVTLNEKPYPIKNELVEVDVIKDKDGVTTYVLAGTDNSNEFRALSIDGNYRVQYSGIIVTSEGSSTGEVLGIALADQEGTKMYTFDEGAQPHAVIKNISGSDVRWLDIKPLTEDPNHTLKYGLEAFVWTVKDAKAGDKIINPFFKQLNASLLALGFHEGDDIALGTNLATLAPTEGVSPLNKVDANDYIHGKNNKATREQEVDTQRANAKEELVAWNKQHPGLTEDREHGTIIDSSGLDVRNGRITLGCGRTATEEVGAPSNVNYGIRMNDSSNSLEFAVSRTIGEVQFDVDGHATNLTSSTLLSIEAGGYISGAPTCLILAQVSRHTNDNPEFYPVRRTTGFDCDYTYDTSSGWSLLIHDYRENISAVLTRNRFEKVPAIIEVQAIYTHPNAETIPAQQMHTYIGEWTNISDSKGIVPDHPGCSFSCNKIEEWMAAVDLPLPEIDPVTNTLIEAGVQLYVVIRVY